jgi:hypothetical protein
VIGRGCDEPCTYRRRVTSAEAVPDDAGRRLVAGEPMTVAEMRHAIGVARQEIVRLVSEVAAERVNSNRALESLWKCRDELNERRAESHRDGQEIARLTAERDAAIREREEEKQKLPVVMRQLVRAAVKAFAELNAIRARDGVPYTSSGWKSDVQEEYFSSVVDELDEAVIAATGKSAHCHPELYA